jgi:tRNA(fMet)-specific endonuclease VapC
MRGWLSYINASKNLVRQVKGYAELQRLFRAYGQRPVLDFDGAALDEFEQLRRSRVRIGTMDLKIAAIALARDALLVSRNVSDFRHVPGLRVRDWSI